MTIAMLLEKERLKFRNFISEGPLKIGRSYHFTLNGKGYSIIGSYRRLICLPESGGELINSKSDEFYQELAEIDDIIQGWIDYTLTEQLVTYFTPDRTKVLAITLALNDRLSIYSFKDSPMEWIYSYMALCVVSTLGVKNSNLYVKWLYHSPCTDVVYIENYITKGSRGALVYRGRRTHPFKEGFTTPDKGGDFLAFMYQKFYLTPCGVLHNLFINNEVLNLCYNARAKWILRSVHLTIPKERANVRLRR